MMFGRKQPTTYTCAVYLVQQPAPGYQTKDLLKKQAFPSRVPLMGESVKIGTRYYRVMVVAHTPDEPTAAELFVRGPIQVTEVPNE